MPRLWLAKHRKTGVTIKFRQSSLSRGIQNKPSKTNSSWPWEPSAARVPLISLISLEIRRGTCPNGILLLCGLGRWPTFRKNNFVFRLLMAFERWICVRNLAPPPLNKNKKLPFRACEANKWSVLKVFICRWLMKKRLEALFRREFTVANLSQP